MAGEPKCIDMERLARFDGVSPGEAAGLSASWLGLDAGGRSAGGRSAAGLSTAAEGGGGEAIMAGLAR